MESKRLNVTEEWLQVITQLTLSYRRNRIEAVKVEVQGDNLVELGQLAEVDVVIAAPIHRNEIKKGNQMF
jgi:hypothetical protein